MTRDLGEGRVDEVTFRVPGAVVIFTYSSESSSDNDIYVSGRGFDRLVLS